MDELLNVSSESSDAPIINPEPILSPIRTRSQTRKALQQKTNTIQFEDNENSIRYDLGSNESSFKESDSKSSSNSRSFEALDIYNQDDNEDSQTNPFSSEMYMDESSKSSSNSKNKIKINIGKKKQGRPIINSNENLITSGQSKVNDDQKNSQTLTGKNSQEKENNNDKKVTKMHIWSNEKKVEQLQIFSKDDPDLRNEDEDQKISQVIKNINPNNINTEFSEQKEVVMDFQVIRDQEKKKESFSPKIFKESSKKKISIGKDKLMVLTEEQSKQMQGSTIDINNDTRIRLNTPHEIKIQSQNSLNKETINLNSISENSSNSKKKAPGKKSTKNMVRECNACALKTTSPKKDNHSNMTHNNNIPQISTKQLNQTFSTFQHQLFEEGLDENHAKIKSKKIEIAAKQSGKKTSKKAEYKENEKLERLLSQPEMKLIREKKIILEANQDHMCLGTRNICSKRDILDNEAINDHKEAIAGPIKEVHKRKRDDQTINIHESTDDDGDHIQKKFKN